MTKTPRRNGAPGCTSRLFILLTALALCAGLLCAPASAFDTERNSDLLILVNKTHSVPSSYVPELQKLSGSVPVGASSLAMRPEAAQAYIDMYNAMRADGVKTCSALSGYRSYSTQSYLVSSRTQTRIRQGMSKQRAYDVTTMYTAPAGTSEHQIGLAVDCVANNGGLNAAFANTAAGKWLDQHAWEYGYILRYEAEKTDLTMIAAEAWHFRYVGVPHAKVIKDSKFCLEEYIEFLHENGGASVAIDGTVYDIFWTDDPELDLTGLEIEDISRDNAGGWIITTVRERDPLYSLRGHWAESAFRALLDLGIEFDRAPDPSAAITGQELARICGLSSSRTAPITRESAAVLLASRLSVPAVPQLLYSDLADIDSAALHSIQACVACGLFSQGPGQAFRPNDALTWAEAAVLADRFRALQTNKPIVT